MQFEELKPVVDPYRPDGHKIGCTEATGQKLPIGQSVKLLAAVVQYAPAGHTRHAVESSRSMYGLKVPEGQSTQLVPLKNAPVVQINSQ